MKFENLSKEQLVNMRKAKKNVKSGNLNFSPEEMAIMHLGTYEFFCHAHEHTLGENPVQDHSGMIPIMQDIMEKLKQHKCKFKMDEYMVLYICMNFFLEYNQEFLKTNFPAGKTLSKNAKEVYERAKATEIVAIEVIRKLDMYFIANHVELQKNNPSGGM